MPRYAAFLRGVSPQNLAMPALKAAFEAAGFADVRTLLSSGNVVFTAAKASPASLQRKAEAAMEQRLGRTFLTIVRQVEALRAMLASDPYRPFELAADAKRVVTFLREKPTSVPQLPIEFDGARVLCVDGAEVYVAYVPSPRGASFMKLIERTFGEAVTTRTWDTVAKVAR